MELIVGACAKNEFFQAKIELMMDTFFPIKTYISKSTDDPYITDWIRKLIKKRNTSIKRMGKVSTGRS